MKTAQPKIPVSRYVTEDESFWQNQLSKFKASGLTRRQYCRQNTVDYYRFTYWKKKLILQQLQTPSEQEPSLEKPKQLLPIQLKPECPVNQYKAPETVSVPFSLSFKNGCILQIHNEQALSVILEKMI